MLIPKEIPDLLHRTENYLTNVLLPFWMERSADSEYGGFLTYFDRNGNVTGETTKTFLMQIRMLFTFSHAHRCGYGGGRCADLARKAAEFILDHYWDDEHDGWFWIADREGRPTCKSKVGYGQCFALYAFSEYALATGDARGREAAERTYNAICGHMVDTARGGYYEIMRQDWQPEPGERGGGDRKSMDVHMHLMEALTTYYEMTGHPSHRRRLIEVIDILTTRMLHSLHGTGYMQFTLDFKPLPAIMFDVEWGSNEDPEDGVARPVDLTSYGHNMEFVWLLLHSADCLGQPRSAYKQIARRIGDHSLRYGIDAELGGVYIEGPVVSPPQNRRKQFWQQAEVLVALLDGFDLFKDDAYWRAFCNTHAFVFEKFINLPAGGEWRALLERDGTPVWDYLGDAWKISYHTVRSMIEICSRLRLIGKQFPEISDKL
ncbi:MAG: AGE family epimerase/isomerase [Lentisphaerae bacterium]|nr:AGE family epimerase/isomerase [Lentisphaerota bacterium]